MLDLASAKLMTKDARKRSFELGYGLLYDVKEVSLEIEPVNPRSFSPGI
jgi:hypothetical protein